MSGGRFDGLQFRFGGIVEDIRTVIVNNDSTEKDELGYNRGRRFPPEIIDRLAATADVVERAAKMVTRVDWLLSDDDGNESFLRRWAEEGLDRPLD
jgi:hypothetical protein